MSDSLIDAIYAAGADPQCWADALGALTRSVSGCGATLHVNSSDGSAFDFGANYNISEEARDAYVRYYHALNPLTHPLSRAHTGAVVSDRALVPREFPLGVQVANNRESKHPCPHAQGPYAGNILSCIIYATSMRTEKQCH
jgi:hypothetical protein